LEGSGLERTEAPGRGLCLYVCLYEMV
jgi:hypothetical protein